MDQRDIFLAALDKEHSSERRAFLDEACGADAGLRAEVEALLRAHTRAGDFLEKPITATAGLPTLPAGTAGAAPRSSAPQVQVFKETPAGFTDETTALLRRRLRAASLALTALMALTLVTTLSFPGLGLRTATLAAVAGCYAVVRSSRPLSRVQLRVVEGIFLVSFVTQAVYMPDVLILERARAGDVATVVLDQHFNTGIWALFVVMYGLLIPNRWPRAVAVIVPLSLLPSLNFYLLGQYEPRVQEAFDSVHHGAPVPLMLIAGLMGIYGAHTLNAIRREAHQARKFGQYRLCELLGRGGMGEVYRAEHELLKRPCAIKLIRPGVDAAGAAVARFEREVQATARLSHWNTVEIFDYGRTDEGIFYYVMELLPGMSLADLVAQYGPLPPGRAVYLLRQVCAALAEAHALHLIHRDIKPANIFAARRGGLDDVAKLLDFGLVKSPRQEGHAGESQEGVISGSPPYMSPEQASAGNWVDPRADIYSLGAAAYFLVTGVPPFQGRTIVDYIVAHARDPVVPPSLRQPDVPLDLEAVILRCLAKQPNDRFPDVRALEAALADCDCAGEWDATRAAEWWAARDPAFAGNHL